MNGNEAFVKIVGLCVLGGIAGKVYWVISPRSAIPTSAVRHITDEAVETVIGKVTKSS
jgi:hypothetical protein